MNVLIALIISLVIPLIFLLLIRNLDFYGTGKFNYTLMAILWGMFAYTLAAYIHSNIMVNASIPDIQVVRVIAPITEELLKAAILIYFVRRADFNYVVDGAIYGFGAGIGFAMLETYHYVAGGHEFALSLALHRVFSTSLIHASASGLIGIALAAAFIERGVRSILFVSAGVLIAVGLHMAFNFMVTEGASLVLAIMAGLASMSCIAFVIRASLSIQREWIAEMLGVKDGVTAGESAVVQRIQDMDEVLAPILQQFGPDKASMTESLLYVQAEIGIKRKRIEMTSDPGVRSAIEQEIKLLSGRMNQLRKAIGPYCMMFVRSVYLARGTRLWDAISERAAAAGSGPAGGGLWSTLNNRIKESKPQDKES